MRKIYSLVLMAAALLIGTNAWATIHDTYDPVNDEASVTFDGINFQYGSIYEAFDAVGYDGVPATIKLLKSPIETTKSIILYVPASLGSSAQPKNITLDMNGCNIQTAATDRKEVNNNPATDYVTEGAHTPFLLFRGTLNITGSGEIINRCTEWHISSGWTYYVSSGITVFGSIYADDFNFANLTVGKDVTIRSVAMTGIGVYATCGYDQVKGEASTSGSLTYTGITISDLGYNTYDPLRTGYGININVYGTVQGAIYGMYMTGIIGGGTPKAIPTNSPNASDGGAAYRAELADNAFPRFFVHSGAQIIGGCGITSSPIANCNNKTQTGIYSSGWGIWQIEGYVKGATGAYIKSGDVTMNNATIESCYEDAYIGAGASNVGGAGAGSAVVINSTLGGYPGNISVTVEGDTKVKGASGNAIEEKVNDNGTHVNAIDIESGTFETTGNQPAITVDLSTKEDPDTKITVSGGNWQDNSANPLLVDNAFVTTTTNEDGKTVYVVGNTTETGGGTVTWRENYLIDTITSPIAHYVKLTAAGTEAQKNQVITGNRKLGYLVLESGTSVTINNGASLEVGEVVIDHTMSGDVETAYGNITVEAGGKLLVTGAKGLKSSSVNSLTIKAQELEGVNKSGIFVFAPSVTSNNHPYCQVQLLAANAKQTGAGEYDYDWYRFTTPLAEYISGSHNGGSVTTYDGSAFRTAVNYWDYSADDWATLTHFNQMQAFQGYSLTNNSVAGGVTYTLRGKLQGNATGELDFHTGYNYFGNSYTAPVHLGKLLQNVATGSVNVDGAAYLWNAQRQRYDIETASTIGTAMADYDDIPALQTFILRKRSGGVSNTADINYAKSVWEYVTHTGSFESAAPQRANSIGNAVRMVVTGANGFSDQIVLMEDARFSAEYEGDADAEKLMNPSGLNIYTTQDNLAILATDDMRGTMLTLQTNDEFDYTISFTKVVGEEYALKDNVTGATVLMSIGNTYNFTAQPNATLDGRFQIVSRQEMPTAVETIENTEAPKAIYTIMGQYVGETTNWNNLPAGVYVVDGVKVIK